jgi:hypothetical protein
MQGAIRCMAVRQLYPQNMQTPSHLCTCLQRHRPSRNTRSACGSLGSNLSTPYHASWSVSCHVRCVRPIHHILRCVPTHCTPLPRAKATFGYYLVCIGYDVLEEYEDVVRWTRDQRRVCGATGRRDGLSL